MPTVENSLIDLPEDKEALKAILRSLLQERDDQRQRAEAQARRADELYLENLQLQKELLRYKKATYGPRADRLTGTSLPSEAATPSPRVLANSSKSTRIADGIGHLRPREPLGAPHPPRSPGAPSTL